MYEWNCPTVVHRLDLLGCEARDCKSTDTRLRADSLNDASWVHLKFSGHGMVSRRPFGVDTSKFFYIIYYLLFIIYKSRPTYQVEKK